MRVCSFLPSATEIVFALGMERTLVGVSHECDYPAGAARLPKVTRTRLDPALSSHEIDIAVGNAMESGEALYDLDFELLERLGPDVILTQRLCDVCAVSSDRVQEAAASLPHKPRVVTLEPHGLHDIFGNIRTIATVLDRSDEGDRLVDRLEQRVDAVGEKSRTAKTRRVLCMEWVDPPYCGGHWMAELVELAGGTDALSNRHRPSCRIEWSKVVAAAPEVIVLTCCGYRLPRCLEEAALLGRLDGIADLPAVETCEVYATDSSAFFSRPGPRIVDSLEILAHLVHPEIFAAPSLSGAWAKADIAQMTTA